MDTKVTFWCLILAATAAIFVKGEGRTRFSITSLMPKEEKPVTSYKPPQLEMERRPLGPYRPSRKPVVHRRPMASPVVPKQQVQYQPPNLSYGTTKKVMKPMKTMFEIKGDQFRQSPPSKPAVQQFTKEDVIDVPERSELPSIPVNFQYRPKVVPATVAPTKFVLEAPKQRPIVRINDDYRRHQEKEVPFEQSYGVPVEKLHLSGITRDPSPSSRPTRIRIESGHQPLVLVGSP